MSGFHERNFENEKNKIATPEINVKTGQVWIHEFFPIIQEVKVTDGMTTQDIIHKLNDALTSPNTKSLNELIRNLEKLKEKNKIPLKNYLKFRDDLDLHDFNIYFSYNPADIDVLLHENLLLLELFKQEIYISLS